jgi:recombination protein RecA
MSREEKKKRTVPTGKDFKSLLTSVNTEIESESGCMASSMGATIDTPHKYSSGILSMDKYLKVGGFLGGRVVNTWGWEGSGKSLLAYTVAAAVQKQRFSPSAGNPEGKGRAVYLDAEGTFSPELASAAGVNLDELGVFRSTPEKILTGEDYFELIKIFIQNGIEMIVVDSVPALVPSMKFDATIGQGQKATHANLMSEGLQQATALLNGHKRTLLWLINQIRMKPMVMFGSNQGPTGGEALKFYASYSLELKKTADIVKKVQSRSGDWEDRQIGVSVKTELHKNKTATIPVKAIDFDIYFETVKDKDGNQYNTGVDTFKDLVLTGIACGVIKQSSSWFSFGDIKGNGVDKLIDAIRAGGPAVIEAIRAEVLGTNVAAPVATVTEQK